MSLVARQPRLPGIMNLFPGNGVAGLHLDIQTPEKYQYESIYHVDKAVYNWILEVSMMEF